MLEVEERRIVRISGCALELLSDRCVSQKILGVLGFPAVENPRHACAEFGVRVFGPPLQIISEGVMAPIVFEGAEVGGPKQVRVFDELDCARMRVQPIG